ncbi:MAG: hypothetical protein IT184_15770 [Acidobacteria bacterium]|nr:hypothetical protein [Acidobacteriota bacterium]
MGSSQDAASFALVAGWIGMLAGVVSGAGIGLFFHDERWLGGYGTFRRRLLRLGHISFFGLGFLNILFGLTVTTAGLGGSTVPVASVALVIGAITMPACCFLSAWREPFRQLFPIPVIAVGSGIVCTLLAWSRP